MKFPGLITRGRGFKTPKKLKINWGYVMIVAIVLLVTLPITVGLITQLTPLSESGQDTPRSPEPGSSAPPLVRGDVETVESDDMVISIGLPLIPLPLISLQQVYYDPLTGKLWYIDDDMCPHEIKILIDTGSYAVVWLEHGEGRIDE